MDTRALKNPYHDYDGNPASTQTLFDSEGKLTPAFAQRLSSKVSELLAVMENGLKSADPRDCTAYTGWAGIALLYLHLHSVFKEASFLQRALDYVTRSLKHLTRRHDVTFLCGDTGPLAVAAVVYSRLQRAQEAEDCISRLLRYQQAVLNRSGGLPDELLYGRVGFLSSLVFLNQQLGPDRVPLHCIQQVSEAVLVSGQQLSRKLRLQNQSPLMYEWYQEQYVGAAHGLAGIYYFLLQPGFVSTEEQVLQLVQPSVEHVCRLRFPSGNYPPCIGDDRDQLVHWCHGAPGVVYMLLQAYKVLGNPRYLEEALQCGEVVWRWGLLKKGYGLCHGAAGNAYTFLGLYRLTQDPKHLYRACMFADWCMNYGHHGCRTPDTPFSLFEGMAGTIYFLADILQPMKARFPAFEV
ncbi:glutathione S-transferase LANCL1 [Poecilia latipinna]|uniref:glutathione S-transferase LANCL1 n=1 Tax=Poecilia latipinna TaxID=48699 RepID=UPI00072E097F|nr:PREDICTED: lanC-like protein 1 [Poecilia latipinna]XP_014881900.1 PREDICTED: lanC-like protein 1 [Poecilia latipinna]XP_014881901.1 PREDICTED: lanC-like protein 1 [Poecilia latipinna]